MQNLHFTILNKWSFHSFLYLFYQMTSPLNWSPEPPASPCGKCMIPTLIPETRSPRAFSLIEYRGSHDTTGKLPSRQLFTLGPEHLSVCIREKKRQKHFVNCVKTSISIRVKSENKAPWGHCHFATNVDLSFFILIQQKVNKLSLSSLLPLVIIRELT